MSSNILIGLTDSVAAGYAFKLPTHLLAHMLEKLIREREKYLGVV